jgi:hypothetical protein
MQSFARTDNTLFRFGARQYGNTRAVHQPIRGPACRTASRAASPGSRNTFHGKPRVFGGKTIEGGPDV